MTTIAEEITRVQLMLQDIDITAGNITLVTNSITEAAQKLARMGYFPIVSWVQAITAQRLYTLSATNVTIDHIIYNERVLRYISEAAFDRKVIGWEALQGEPRYWTDDNQARNAFRVIPAPSRSGIGVVFNPANPVSTSGVDNFLVFVTQDESANLGATVMPTLLDYDDFMVYYGTYLHATKESTQHNAPLAEGAAALAAMWLQLMERDRTGGTS